MTRNFHNPIPISACSCGGFPFMAQHYDEKYDEVLYYVRCYKCRKNGMFEYKDDDAITSWNKENMKC